jgi:dynein light chain 4, axonemal
LLQKAAQAAKEGLDRKFGAPWHCVVGEGFSYNVTHQAACSVFLYYAEKLGVLVWKA